MTDAQRKRLEHLATQMANPETPLMMVGTEDAAAIRAVLAEIGQLSKHPTRDIVERLRDYGTCHDGDIDEAADEIEKLRAELAAMKAAPTRNLEHYHPQESPNRYPLELCPDGHICLWCPKGETKVTIAYLYADNEGDFDFRFVGDRPLDSRVDWAHFRECVEQGFRMMRRQQR